MEQHTTYLLVDSTAVYSSWPVPVHVVRPCGQRSPGCLDTLLPNGSQVASTPQEMEKTTWTIYTHTNFASYKPARCFEFQTFVNMLPWVHLALSILKTLECRNIFEHASAPESEVAVPITVAPAFECMASWQKKLQTSVDNATELADLVVFFWYAFWLVRETYTVWLSYLRNPLHTFFQHKQQATNALGLRQGVSDGSTNAPWCTSDQSDLPNNYYTKHPQTPCWYEKAVVSVEVFCLTHTPEESIPNTTLWFGRIIDTSCE